jgi:SH3 domain-binding glutamic acid-rich protein
VTDASPLSRSLPVKSILSEEAVEYGELETFLRLKDTWDETIEETRPTLPTKPIGVPGASSPSQMAKPAHRALFNASPGGGPSSPLRGASASPSPAETKKSLRNRRDAEFDVSDELTGYGLQGVKVTDDDLLALVEELGLGGEEAGDLVKGLSDPTDKADKVKEDEATEVREGGGDGGAGGSEQPESKSETSAEAKPVAREEAEAAAEGDGVEKAAAAAETEVAETDAGAPST